MIKELESPFFDYETGYSGASNEEIIEKINEIIRYLNEKEDEN